MSWMEKAACRGMDPELFDHPGGPSYPVEAQQACEGCPVRDQCQEYLLQWPVQTGWGAGLTADARAALRLRLQRSREKVTS